MMAPRHSANGPWKQHVCYIDIDCGGRQGKLSHLIMPPQKSICSKNFGFNEHNCILRVPFPFLLGWFSIINNLIITHNNITN